MRSPRRALAISVIAIASFGQLPLSGFQSTDYVTDPEAYAAYAAVLPSVWRGNDAVKLLQAETEGIDKVTKCLDAIIEVA